MVLVELQIASSANEIPSTEQFSKWFASALPEGKEDAELSLRVVDAPEIQTLNFRYRHKNKPTNVLAFPCELAEEIDMPLLGDLVMCAPVIAQEALDQNKALEAHWAHMLVHGTLHLLGYDHIVSEQATEMESIETRILRSLNYAPPYR